MQKATETKAVFLKDAIQGTLSSKDVYESERFPREYEITRMYRDVRCRVWIGDKHGFVIIDRFQSPIRLNALLLGTVADARFQDVTAACGAPFPVGINAAAMAATELNRIFLGWDVWKSVLEPFEVSGESIFVCESQCNFGYPHKFIPQLAKLVLDLAKVFSSPPFTTLPPGEPYRLGTRPAVPIDVSRVPVELRHLIPFVVEWSIPESNEVAKYAETLPREQIESFVKAFYDQADEVEEYCRTVVYPNYCETVGAFSIALEAFGLMNVMYPVKRK